MKLDHVNESDPRVKRTRKLLEDAFLSLLGEMRFQAITVQDIADRATVNRATFYAHFVDKYALLDQILGRTIRETLRRRVSVSSPFNQSNLQLLTVTILEFLAGFRDHCMPPDRSLDPLIEPKVQQELFEFIKSWLDQTPTSEARQRVPREAIASVLSWAIFGAGIEWSRGDRTISAEEKAGQVISVIADGVTASVATLSLPRGERNGGIIRS